MYVITANRLSDGAVVYFDKNQNWSENLNDAFVTNDEEVLNDSLQRATLSINKCVVVAIYQMVVEFDSMGKIIPVSWRELIRANGPTVAIISDNITGRQKI